MTFSKKANAQPTHAGNDNSEGNEVSQEQWNEWARYQYDTFKGKARELPNGKFRKEKNLIGKVNLIVDLGFPPAADSQWKTECALPSNGEEYSQEEVQWMEKNPTHNFIWEQEWDDTKKSRVTVRKQTSPSYPAQEYGVAVDFPQVMIDYSKHPQVESTEEDLRPLRISLNGNFNHKFFKTIVFDGSFKPVSDKNLVYKICVAAGLEKELISSEFDIATAAGVTCNFSVRADLDDQTDEDNNGKVYVNWNASKPSAIEDLETPQGEWSADEQIQGAFEGKYVPEFTGILLDGMTYTNEMLEELGKSCLGLVSKDIFGYVKHATTSEAFLLEGISKKTNNAYSIPKGLDFKGTDFAKAWEKFAGSDTPSAQQPAKPQESSEKKDKPAEKVTPTKAPVEPVSDDSWDDDNL